VEFDLFQSFRGQLCGYTLSKNEHTAEATTGSKRSVNFYFSLSTKKLISNEQQAISGPLAFR
jgi:hypothetical protein